MVKVHAGHDLCQAVTCLETIQGARTELDFLMGRTPILVFAEMVKAVFAKESPLSYRTVKAGAVEEESVPLPDSVPYLDQYPPL